MRSAILILALALTPLTASPGAAEEQTLFKFLRLETDYADWGAAEREITWDGEGWIGGDTEKIWLKTEGEWTDGELEDAEFQLLYSRNIAAFWDAQIGIRHDLRPDPANYLALALNGLAPYFFESDLSAFLSDEGDVSARADLSYDLLITQGLIAEPYLEANFYAQDVPELEVGAGLSDIDAGLRVRYEIEREFAPYIDLNYTGLVGETHNIAQASGRDPDNFALRIGLRFWLN